MNHNKYNSHKKHHSSMHGSAEGFLRKFWLVTVLLVPLLLLSEPSLDYFGLNVLGLEKYLQFLIATIIFYVGKVFFEHASHELKAKKPGMMTLVSLGVGSGYLFSAVSTFLPALQAEFYIEISTLVWILLFGHYLEAKSSTAAGNALDEVAKLLPTKVNLVTEGSTKVVSIKKLKKEDKVLVKPGERIPADGLITNGNSHVNESLITGESKPVAKNVNDKVTAGSIVEEGALTIKVTGIGKDSTVGHIEKLIKEAQKTKPSAQKLADKASGWLTFIALGASILTILVWTLFAGQTFVFSITLAITVLVIACPHALGLAIPTVTTIATKLAVKNGFFIKDISKIETAKNINYVVLDKTGTLTEGNFGVRDIISTSKKEQHEILQIAKSLEQNSSHIIGTAIVNYAKSKNIESLEVENFKNHAGKGVTGNIKGTQYFIGNYKWIKSHTNVSKNIEEKYKNLLEKGNTTILLTTKKQVIGLISLADKIKKSSYKAIKDLHKMNIKAAMLTGDNRKSAESVANELNIDTYYAEVLPENKYKYVKKLQDKGNIVMMVGDGVNDAPALTQADVGVAIGAGTDVAVESGDIILTNSNPGDIVKLIKLSKKVYLKMVQNLWWALGYNIVAIPAAAGVFYSLGFILRPQIGALVMSLSSVIVVINAMTLRKIKL